MNKQIRAKSNPSFFHVYTFNSQGGPPAVTKNEKSSSLIRTASLEDAENTVRFS